jgi:hypothetical protein
LKLTASQSAKFEDAHRLLAANDRAGADALFKELRTELGDRHFLEAELFLRTASGELGDHAPALLAKLNPQQVVELGDQIGAPALRKLAGELDGSAILKLRDELGADVLRKLGGELGGAKTRALVDSLGAKTVAHLATDLDAAAIVKLEKQLGAATLSKLTPHFSGARVAELTEKIGDKQLVRMMQTLNAAEVDTFVTRLGIDRLAVLAKKFDGDVLKHYGVDFFANYKGISAQTRHHLVRGDGISRGKVLGHHDRDSRSRLQVGRVESSRGECDRCIDSKEGLSQGRWQV